nr:peroxide stress-activated histidine kinase mak1 [Quercus suber]
MPNDGELTEDEIYIRFEVIDTGRGFTEREAEFLFKRFSQIDGSSTRQHGGTGLGLVISRQLAQLHGGDMLAKAVPGKGSTFTFIVKVFLPSEQDQSSPPPVTPGAGLPQVPILPGPRGSSSTTSRLTKVPSVPERMQLPERPKYSPKSVGDHKQSPLGFMSPDHFRESPGASSASSEPSVRSEARTGSLHSSSTRSSASAASSISEAVFTNSQTMSLSLPAERKSRQGSSSSNTASEANQLRKSSLLAPKIHIGSPTSGQLSPPMSSILVVCPLKYSREATVQHIDMTLPKNIPHQITARENLLECQKMLGGNDPVIFTHVVVVLQDVGEITALMDQVFSSHVHHSTTVVIITDLAQRRKIMEQAPQHDYEKLDREHRLRFVFKPLKPSRFAIIFDPRKEREMSTDRNQDSAQQVALNQKQVFEKLAHRLGNKDKRVLLVEDNKINQMVVLQFLAKVSIKAETAMDGVQCTDKLFAQPHGHYSIILCDLHMPNKDGYQTCKEIRTWERQNRLAHLPIIALSANVLGDVYQKCVDAGFNSYMTKPVDFNELSTMLMTFMDPSDPTKPHEFMKLKRGQAAQQKR